LNLILAIVIVTFALLAGAEYLFHRSFIRRKKTEAEQRARTIVEDAERQTDLRLKELEIESRGEGRRREAAFEAEMRKKRADHQAARRQLEEQERLLERKAALLTRKQGEMETREGALQEREAALQARQQEFQTLVEEQRARLERLAGMSAQQAKRELMREMEGQARAEAAVVLEAHRGRDPGESRERGAPHPHLRGPAGPRRPDRRPRLLAGDAPQRRDERDASSGERVETSGPSRWPPAST
jgi:ribonuclease Y